MKYRIMEMHPADAHYPNKDNFIGKIIEAKEIEYCCYDNLGEDNWKYVVGSVEGEDGENTFLAIKLKAVRKYTKKEKVSAS